MRATSCYSPPSIISDLSAAILRTLAYFDVFKHPLTAQEIFECCDCQQTTLLQVCKELAELRHQGCIHQEANYYSLDQKSNVKQRLLSGLRCEQYMHPAHRYSRLIARFPFVRGVCISGSLSKGCADENADVDYFIITQAGHLWTCRTLLTLFKKTILLNSHKYFCLNYFVDNKHLAIPDKNIFTATEIAFLIPTYDYTTYNAFREANDWTKRYYPHKPSGANQAPLNEGDGWLKRWAEALLSGRLGEAIETICLRLTRHYRRNKFREMEKNEFEHAMRATKGVSKHHPNNFQFRVLKAYEQNLQNLQSQLGVQLV